MLFRSSLVESVTAPLQTDGSLVTTFTSPDLSGNSYYLKITSRNMLETWSANPVLLSATTTYDFTDDNLKAYQDPFNSNPQTVEVEPGVWAMYNGDVNQDGTIDALDFNDMEIDVNNFEFGYFATDITGAGPVDALDFNLLEINSSYFLFVAHP